MNFENLDVRSIYDSRRGSVYHEFFNKVLAHSSYYLRFGGLFSAKTFSLLAEGLQDFIKENNGYMKIAIVPVFTEEDREALFRGISVDDIISNKWIKDLSEIKEKFVEDHKLALSWMIANKFLEVKLILPQNPDGKYCSVDELKELPILREEIGIMYNVDDQSQLSFHAFIDGDNPESGEISKIDVYRNWIPSESKKIEKDFNDLKKFLDDDFYQFEEKRFLIRPLSQELESYFKEIAPKTKDQIPTLTKPPKLRPHQEDAVTAWVGNEYRGIFEMATATGKTFAGIGCIETVRKKEKNLLVIITAPYTNLVSQWKDELSKWSIQSSPLDSSNWTKVLRDEIDYLNRSKNEEFSVLIVSHDLFIKEKFVKAIERVKNSAMLVADEAHHLGTYTSSLGLSPKYYYRLALSATITRYFDDDGTQLLRNYFGKTVFEYTLEQAIQNNLLCKYYYYPHFVELKDDEYLKYKDLTNKAARWLNSKNPDDRKNAEFILNERAKIIRDAENKIDCFREILKQMSHLKRLLVFCSEKQFDWVEDVLNNLEKYCGIGDSIHFRRITHDDPSDKKARMKILKEFAGEEWNVLLSNRVLDEGMDIPQAQNCIILASTGNPTQFIQRRGRVLRKYDDVYKDGTKKDFAYIYDILVKPKIDNLDPESIKLEISMIRNQFDRIKTMSNAAVNRDECNMKITEFTYDLPLNTFDINK